MEDPLTDIRHSIYVQVYHALERPLQRNLNQNLRIDSHRFVYDDLFEGLYSSMRTLADTIE